MICIFLLLLLTSCENNVGGDAFFNQINKIETELIEPNWDGVIVQAEELKEIYKKDKWKIQLLGDEDEYESLYESINKLITASKEKDLTNTRIELTTIHTHIEDIYSL
jgi:hypothetical protein